MMRCQTYMTPEKQYKLDLSKQETVDLAQRDLRCPNCRFIVTKVYGDIRGHMEFKCPKCREIYVVNLTYFRERTRSRYLTLTRVIQD